MTVDLLSSPRPFTIVVGLKFSDGGAFAVDQGARLTHQIPLANLHFVHVFETPLSASEAKAMLEHLQLYANEKAVELGLNGRTVGVHVRSGDIVREIAQVAIDVAADLVVLGSDVHSLPSWRTDRLTEGLMRLVSCPVLMAGLKPTPARSEPVIEPSCAECLSTRGATNGAGWWCPRHSTHALEAHAYSYQRELPFATRDTLLGPTGA